MQRYTKDEIQAFDKFKKSLPFSKIKVLDFVKTVQSIKKSDGTLYKSLLID